MSSSIGNNTAEVIVDTDTVELIAQADSIVQSCTGLNCNISPDTQNKITQNLSSTAQTQANDAIKVLSIPPSSILARDVFDGYIELATAVSSTYNYQCGATTVNSASCVTSSSSVQSAQNNLVSLLSPPAEADVNHIVIVSILMAIAVTAFILFFVFLIIGLVGSLTAVPSEGAAYIERIQEAATNVSQANQVQIHTTTPPSPPVVQQIAVPASPFDTTEPVYE